MNVTLGSGKAVHYSTTPEGFMPGPDCGGNRATERYTVTSADVTCKRCLTIVARVAERAAEEAEIEALTTGEPVVDNTPADTAKIAPAINTTDKGDTDTMAETTPITDYDRIAEEINSNVERARSLAEADNVEALEELNTETETLISRLPSRGKRPGTERTWTQYKKDKRAEFKAAATVQEKPAKAEPKAEVATLETKDYATVEGVTELVTMGAERVTDGVTAHIKTSSLAKDIASVLLDIRRRIHNKDGNPDLTARTDAAKKAASAIYAAAGESLGKGDLDAYDVEESVKKLRRAVQHQMSDVQAAYLRGLDESPEEAALFAKILEGKPEDTPVALWVANHYDLKLKGQGEIARERYHEKKALEAGEAIKTSGEGAEGGEGEGEGEGGEGAATPTPDEHVKAVVAKLIKDIKAAKPDDFENASEETKDAVRAQLEEASKALKAMVAAVL